jgi:hypothetical protein
MHIFKKEKEKEKQSIIKLNKMKSTYCEYILEKILSTSDFGPYSSQSFD